MLKTTYMAFVSVSVNGCVCVCVCLSVFEVERLNSSLLALQSWNIKYVCVCLCTLSFVMVSQSSIYSYIIEHMVCDRNGCSLTECVMVCVLTCAD